MKLVRLDSLFQVKYGSNLELNALTKTSNGINFVSRTAKNNGVSAIVEKIKNLQPIQAGVLTVAGGGSVLETFLQSEPFYSGRDLYHLIPKLGMTNAQKLFYARCIRANRYKYSYGRQANKTLKELLLPDFNSLPAWIDDAETSMQGDVEKPALIMERPLFDTCSWKKYLYIDLFDIKKGKRLTKADMKSGDTPYIGAIDGNNGVTAKISALPLHKSNCISVSYNGSVAEAFYQPCDFWATDDVNVLYPKFKVTPSIALFLCTLIKHEKYRYNYGRKWGLEKMKQSTLKLPSKDDGNPDWEYMENYIKTLPYSSNV